MPERASVDYHEAITGASKSVLLEITTILKIYRDSLVLIGGWVPYFLLQGNQPSGSNFSHIGSIDIDFVIDPEKIDETVYATMAQMLLKRGYISSKEILYQFERTVKSDIDGKKYTIKIDFLCPVQPQRQKHRHSPIQPDMKVRNLNGAEIVFLSNQKIRLSGTLPDNGRTTVDFKTAALAGFMALKGIAFGDRYKEKYAYDIYVLCDYYKRGPASVAEEIKGLKDNPIVRKGLLAVKERFRAIDSEGPYWVANFIASTDAEREKIRQRSFQVINETIQKIGI
jgi:hypothetical protein